MKLLNIETLLIILTTYGVGLTSTYAGTDDLLAEAKANLQAEVPQGDSFTPIAQDVSLTPMNCVQTSDEEVSCTESETWYDDSLAGRTMWNRIFSNDRLYSAYTAWEIKPGNERVLGDGQIMVPLWQTTDSLLFADLRGQMDDQQSYEGNWGMGFRQIRNDSWILGVYGYYDLRHTEFGNDFNQGTFGLEALSVEWEARVNGYIPETGSKSASSLNSAGISNGTIVVRAGEERAYHGVDAEIGRFLMTGVTGTWNCVVTLAAITLILTPEAIHTSAGRADALNYEPTT